MPAPVCTGCAAKKFENGVPHVIAKDRIGRSAWLGALRVCLQPYGNRAGERCVTVSPVSQYRHAAGLSDAKEMGEADLSGP